MKQYKNVKNVKNLNVGGNRMKFTSKDLLKAMNLQIGDKIKTYISTFII